MSFSIDSRRKSVVQINMQKKKKSNLAYNLKRNEFWYL